MKIRNTMGQWHPCMVEFSKGTTSRASFGIGDGTVLHRRRGEGGAEYYHAKGSGSLAGMDFFPPIQVGETFRFESISFFAFQANKRGRVARGEDASESEDEEPLRYGKPLRSRFASDMDESSDEESVTSYVDENGAKQHVRRVAVPEDNFAASDSESDVEEQEPIYVEDEHPVRVADNEDDLNVAPVGVEVVDLTQSSDEEANRVVDNDWMITDADYDDSESDESDVEEQEPITVPLDGGDDDEFERRLNQLVDDDEDVDIDELI